MHSLFAPLFFFFGAAFALGIGAFSKYVGLTQIILNAVGCSASKSESVAKLTANLAFAWAGTTAVGALISFYNLDVALWLTVVAANILAVLFLVKLYKTVAS